MRTLFVDTSYWIARSDPRDALHDRAVGFDKELSDVRLVTTDLVLIEWLNAVSGLGAHAREEAVRQIPRMEDTDRISIIYHDKITFWFVREFYRQHSDKEWSYTDCVSFWHMRNSEITEALTYDHHFEQAGFRALLRK